MNRSYPNNTTADSLILGGLSASLLGAWWIYSHKRYLWFDELLTRLLVSDESLTHMLRALGDQVDTTPPLFYILGWAWTKIMGNSEASLRLLSAAPIIASAWLIYRLLRSLYDTLPVAIAVVAVYCVSELVFAHLGEARFYGVFLFLASLNVVLWDWSRDGRRGRVFLAHVVTHSALVYCHVFGFFYSCATGMAWLLRRGPVPIRRAALAGIAAGWLSFVFWIPSYLRQIGATGPKFWITKPGLMELFSSLNVGLPLAFVLSVFMGLGWLATSEIGQRAERAAPPKRGHDLQLLALAYLAVPVVGWVVSVLVKPIFVTRYFIPTTLSWVIVFSFIGDRLGLGALRRWIAWGTIAILLCYPIAFALHLEKRSSSAFKDPDCGHEQLPVVFDNATDYLTHWTYARDPSRYSVLIDWPSALESSNVASTLNYKILAALRRNYPRMQIIESGSSTGRLPDAFLLCEDPTLMTGKLWMTQARAEFNNRPVGELNSKSVHFVEKRASVPAK